MPRKEVYNEKLINKLVAVKKKAGVSYDVMAYLLGAPHNTTYKYMTKRRSMVRSDYERAAVAAIKILTQLIVEKKLPLKRKVGRPSKASAGEHYQEIIALIDDCAERLIEETK